MSELRKCSRCHSTKLEQYFSVNVKGELYKLCDNCRTKQKEYTHEEWKEKIQRENTNVCCESLPKMVRQTIGRTACRMSLWKILQIQSETFRNKTS